MSRGVRDLREVICVSRLSYKDSDDEQSDEELGRASRMFGRLNVKDSARWSPVNEGVEPNDSGFSTNGNGASPETEGNEVTVPQPPKNVSSGPKRKHRNRKKKSPKVVDIHPFPRAEPLPPVTSRPSSSSGESGIYTRPGSSHGNFDDLLLHLDMAVVAEWLSTANEVVGNLAVWVNTGDNCVQFSHFWLSQIQEKDKLEVFRLEYGILLDQMQWAFRAAVPEKIKRSDLRHFLEAVFREYPARLYSKAGDHLFLDNLDILSSERQSAYRRLLSDVKCSTQVRQYAQTTLAIRAFALVSVWSAIVKFFRRLEGTPESPARPVSLQNIGKMSPYLQRMHQAISLGYLDVVHYLLVTCKVRVNDLDDGKRSLIHIAVLHNQISILKYLLFSIKPPPDVNQAATSGNTPLHVAANNGNADILCLLVKSEDVDLNAQNPECDHATPLHLAAMYGHETAVAELIGAGANCECLMNGDTPLKIAKDFEHHSVVDLLEKNSPALAS